MPRRGSVILHVSALLAVFWFACAPAGADTRRGQIYLYGWGAATLPMDMEIRTFMGGPVAPNDVNFDFGYRGGLAVGYHFDMFRVEAEGSYGVNDFDSFEIFGQEDDLRGDMTATSLMANIYGDIPINQRMDFYVGGGVGAAQVEVDFVLGEPGDELRLGGRDTVFAYQMMLGVTYYLNERLALTGGYRLWSTARLSFDDSTFTAPLVHSLEIGLRFTF